MDSSLRALVDLRDRAIQKSRIAFSNRVSALESGADNGHAATLELMQRWKDKFQELEKEVDKDIARLAKDLPIIQHMIEVKGVGPLLSAKVVSMIDIERASTVSALWRYCGYAVINGEREKLTKGEKSHYNIRLKTTCYLVASSFLKSGSPYRDVYDSAREYYEVKQLDWTKGHKHNAAMRKMTKMWLSHLWTTWRTIEGLPVTDPYVQDKLGHDHIISPQDFGWPELAVRAEEPKKKERAIDAE